MILAEIFYFTLISILGLKIVDEKSEKEVDTDIEKGDTKNRDHENETEREINKTLPKKNKMDEESIETKDQGSIIKRAFFLKKDDFVSRLTRSLVKMSSLKTSKDPEIQAKFLLNHNNLCSEIDGAFMHKSYFESIPARLYMIFSMLRCFGLILLILILH